MMFTKVDEIHLPDHFYLESTDECFFYGEYTAREKWDYSETNSLIKNIKKEMSRKGRPEWQYKERDIRQCSFIIKRGLSSDWLNQVTLIPVPPSKSKLNPFYDDRMVRILEGIDPARKYDIRELIVQTVDCESSHTSQIRHKPEDLVAMYSIDKSLVDPPPNCLAVVDDVLTTGSHFKAIQTILTGVYPGVPIVGIFIARRVPQNPFANIDLSELF